jgi:hypothetical protein
MRSNENQAARWIVKAILLAAVLVVVNGLSSTLAAAQGIGIDPAADRTRAIPSTLP